MTVAAFDITENKFTTPDPAALCKSSEAMFGDTSVIYADCDKDIESIVASNGKTLRFCLADRTVYLVRNESNWASITLLPK
jgi:hypothetical protein